MGEIPLSLQWGCAQVRARLRQMMQTSRVMSMDIQLVMQMVCRSKCCMRGYRRKKRKKCGIWRYANHMLIAALTAAAAAHQ